jgi:hypothetical protein
MAYKIFVVPHFIQLGKVTIKGGAYIGNAVMNNLGNKPCQY